MTINEKLKRFLSDEKISLAKVAELYGKTPQYISNIIRGGKVPLDLVVTLKKEYPQLDVNKLVSSRPVVNMVMEEQAAYGSGSGVLKDKIIAEFGAVLDRYIK